MEKETKPLFSANVLEFVTVAAELCAFLESVSTQSRTSFVDKALKLLPLLYVKASLLPPFEEVGGEQPEQYVTEDSYNAICTAVARLMGNKDDYLDVFVDDMVYSDQPIRRTISEDIADIYQDIRNFVFVFQLGLEEPMHDALAICQEDFGNYWGQKLVNTLRALHDVKYHTTTTDDFDEEDI